METLIVMHYHYVRGNYEETNTQNHAKSPCFEKIPNTSILVRIGIRRLIHSLYHKMQPDASSA